MQQLEQFARCLNKQFCWTRIACIRIIFTTHLAQGTCERVLTLVLPLTLNFLVRSLICIPAVTLTGSASMNSLSAVVISELSTLQPLCMVVSLSLVPHQYDGYKYTNTCMCSVWRIIALTRATKIFFEIYYELHCSLNVGHCWSIKSCYT